MIHAISPQFNQGPIVGNTRPWVATVKNFLKDRITKWGDVLLQTATIYHIAQAFFFFIGGSFFLALFSAGASLLFIKSIVDLRQMGDLKKRIDDLGEERMKFGLENIHFKKSNLELKEISADYKQQLLEFKEQVGKLTIENEKFEKSNIEYSRLNKIHEEQIENLKAATTKLVHDIEATLRSGQKVTRTIFEGFLRAAKGLEVYEKRVDEVCAQLKRQNSKALKEFQQVTESVKNMTWQGVEIVNKAAKKLESLNALIEEKEERLETVTRDLEKVNKDLKATSRELRTNVDAAVESGFLNLKTHLYSHPGGPTMTVLWLWASIGVVASARFIFSRFAAA